MIDDAFERVQAKTTFDRNVVVTAGAGTGKTRLLVDRMIHLLLREPHPLRVTEIAALTFTRKAASEMRTRLRERLLAYIEIPCNRPPETPFEEQIQSEVGGLIERYAITLAQMEERIREALRQVDQCEIGTMHSFAATLLRLFPLEAGLDPGFQEDDGSRWEAFFEEAWGRWLDLELSAHAPRRDLWMRVLEHTPLSALRSMAVRLMPESVSLSSPQTPLMNRSIPEPIRAWLSDLESAASRLLSEHTGNRQIERQIRMARSLFQKVLETGETDGLLAEDAYQDLSSGKKATKPKDWEDTDMERAEEIIRVSRRLLQVDQKVTSEVLDLLIPLAIQCRRGFHEKGWIPFDGLLAGARNLLRDCLPVREALKERFQAILVDEFQDTDPLQYEILLFLSEEKGRQAESWQGVQLERGKIFVVGDPKQSIYSFRGADMEAYLRVVENVLVAQEGLSLTLTSNYRSHLGILGVINGLCHPLIQPREGLQPEYVPVYPAVSQPSPGDASTSDPFRGVTLRMVQPAHERLDSDAARRLEGESIARWLSEEVIGKATIQSKDGRPQRVRQGHVALLMRKLTRVHDYLEPLRRWGIRYVVEGEKHFYAAQEVIDAVNLFKTILDPQDKLALFGVLRSPMGGLTDRRIYELQERGLLNYRLSSSLTEIPAWENIVVRHVIESLYRLLDRLHHQVQRLPVGQAIARIFEATPLVTLAAEGQRGEQAVANLDKLHRIALEMGSEGATFREVVGRFCSRIDSVVVEGESPLADEDVDAVKVLSIHKSKGLEFPVVVLAGCHTAGKQGESGEEGTQVYQDWATGLSGIRLGDAWDLPGVFLSEKDRLRNSAEERRLFYVAMTRAREHLTISGTLVGRRNGTFFGLLEDVLGEIPSAEDPYTIPIGDASLVCQVIREEGQSHSHVRETVSHPGTTIDASVYAQEWTRRRERYEQILKSPGFVSPSILKSREGSHPQTSRISGIPTPTRTPGYEDKDSAGGSIAATEIGVLAHRLMETWNFTQDVSSAARQVSQLLHRWDLAGSSAGPAAIEQELLKIFIPFSQSQAYDELRSARILGREIPLCMSLDGQIITGAMDLLYEYRGEVFVADYKTDRVDREGIDLLKTRYLHQARIYTEAARRALQREAVGFKLILLRLGQSVLIE